MPVVKLTKVPKSLKGYEVDWGFRLDSAWRPLDERWFKSYYHEHNYRIIDGDGDTHAGRWYATWWVFPLYIAISGPCRNIPS